MEERFSSLLKRLEVVTAKLESGAVTAAPAAPALSKAASAVEDEVVPPSVLAFDEFIACPVTHYVNLANKLNMPEVAKQAALVKQAFEAQRAMLVKVPKAKKPTPAEFQEVAKETSELIAKVMECATTDRRAPDYHHRQAMCEAIPALGWVMVEKTPGPHVADSW